MFLLLAFAIGVVAGLRSMTAPAVVAWAAWRHALSLGASPFAFMASPWTAAIFGVLALGELVVDKLPSTPSRTALGGLAARIVSGGLCGAAIASSATASVVLGALAGAAGGVAGAFGGYELRMRATRATKRPIFVALMEDGLAIGGGLLLVSA